MHYYQHHIGDFIRDTARLSDSQCMAYLRMIWHYYETEQPIENDVDAIAFRFGANASDVHQILKHYFFLHEGRWHNSRCDKEILAFRRKSEKAKESANARWENAKAMRTHSERNADEPISDANQEPITTISNADALDTKTKPYTPPIDSDLLKAWREHRGKHKISEILFNAFQRESVKAGITVEDAIRISIEKGWRGFDADWLDKKGAAKGGGYQERFDPTRYVNDPDYAADWDRRKGGGNGNVIDVTPQRLA